MGPNVSLYSCGKSRPPPGFDPRAVQPVARSYTDYATRPTKGSVSNEIYKAVCIVLTGELAFGVILGKLKQE